MNIDIEIDEEEIKQLVAETIQQMTKLLVEKAVKDRTTSKIAER